MGSVLTPCIYNDRAKIPPTAFAHSPSNQVFGYVYPSTVPEIAARERWLCSVCREGRDGTMGDYPIPVAVGA